MDLYIYCAGGLGQEVAFLAQRKNKIDQKYASISFIDDVKGFAKIGEIPCIAYADFRTQVGVDDCEISIANGEPVARKQLYNKVKADGYSLATLLDPQAIVAPNACLEEGCIVMGGASISPYATVGQNALIYFNAVVAHNSCVGPHSLVSIHATIAGNCCIGYCSFIGAAAVLREETTIGEHCIIGMGSVVLNDVKPFSVIYGVPGKMVRSNTEWKVFKKQKNGLAGDVTGEA